MLNVTQRSVSKHTPAPLDPGGDMPTSWRPCGRNWRGWLLPRWRTTNICCPLETIWIGRWRKTLITFKLLFIFYHRKLRTVKPGNTRSLATKTHDYTQVQTIRSLYETNEKRIVPLPHVQLSSATWRNTPAMCPWAWLSWAASLTLYPLRHLWTFGCPRARRSPSPLLHQPSHLPSFSNACLHNDEWTLPIM